MLYKNQAQTFRYVQESLRGASVVEVGSTELASNAHPIVLVNGEFVCQVAHSTLCLYPAVCPSMFLYLSLSLSLSLSLTHTV